MIPPWTVDLQRWWLRCLGGPAATGYGPCGRGAERRVAQTPACWQGDHWRDENEALSIKYDKHHWL